MYHLAGKFTSKEEAGQVYNTLERTLKERRFYAHVTRLLLGSDWYVSLIYDGEESQIPVQTKQAVQRVLSRGQICQLPRDTIEVIQQRRKDRRSRGIGTFESHDATQVSYRMPVLRDAETKEELQSYPELTEIIQEAPYGPTPGSPVYAVSLKDVPREMRAQVARIQADARRKHMEASRPFFIRYRAYVDDISLNEVFDIHIALYKELLRTTTPYLFTDSALKLLQTVQDPGQRALPIPDKPTWIELIQPLEMPHGTVKALSIYNMRVPEALERVKRKYPGIGDIDRFRIHHTMLYRVDLIGPDMQLLTAETYDAESGQWVYLPQHQCPTGACRKYKGRGYGSGYDDDIAVAPCTECAKRTAFCASWVRTALLMIDREYAVSPEPEPWATQVIAYEEEGTQKVGKGKNAHVIKVTRKREIEYKIISFDVSVPAPRREQSVHAIDAQGDEKRPNWLTLHGKDDIIYRRVHFEDIERHYSQHTRLLQRCKEAGGRLIVQEGDRMREYRLEQRPDGTVVVVSKIVPFDKYVPMLREKKPTIRRVVASAYEHK